MSHRAVVAIERNVIRPLTLDGPAKWAKGDFTKTYSDGAQEDATYDEYIAFIGLPPQPNIEISE